MSKYLWRKNKLHSSIKNASKTLAAENRESSRFVSLALGVAMVLSSTANAERFEEIVDFDIPQQRADLSLTEFAKQANITLIFPFDSATYVTTNTLTGEHSIEEAIRLLLADTSLLVNMEDEGPLTIAKDPSLKESNIMYKKNKLSSAIAGVLSSIIATQAIAQDDSAGIEEVTVTGIRASLQRSMDVKRDASGVVDAISAEDMGKFPDTNLAESLQRITGVSINRVNGEGSEVTVRGFGGGFNLVTLNGRQMPTANVGTISGNPLDQFGSGTSRSFDFSNLASEGVSGIQVYKTGRASIATGGVGATINVQTMKPLDNNGTAASIGVKAVNDTSGDDITPEVSGLYSWVDDGGTFGVSVFGSYQERDSGSRHASVEEYGLVTWDDNNEAANLANLGLVDDVSITNRPTHGQLVARPTNLGLGTNEDSRERLNGQVTLQYAPSENITITADAMYAKNTLESTALIDGIWFNGTVDTVVYDGNPVVAAPEYFAEDVDGGKDFFFQNLDMATEDTLQSFGLNVDWQVSDRLNLAFDAASSEAESGGAGPMGLNSLRVNVGGATAGWQAADFTQEIPQAIVSVSDLRPSLIPGTVPNGIFDLPDVGTQVTQSQRSSQEANIDQFSLDGVFEINDDMKVDFGVGFLGSENHQIREASSNALGGWGVDAPGDIPEGLVWQVCTICEFDYSGTTVAGSPPAGETAPIQLGSVSWRADPLTLLNATAPIYGLDPVNPPLNATADNLVEEDITSIYAQVEMNVEMAGLPTNLVFGARYEETDVTSTSQQGVPTAIDWTSNNDFAQILGSGTVTLTDDYSYSNFLPSLDVSVDISEALKGRVSFSKTIGRPKYSDMYTATSLTDPNRITHLGSSPAASKGNARLDPLESTNFDISLEYYYGDANYISVGYYQKDVANFVGIQQTSEPLFNLLDSTATSSTFLSQAITDLAALGVSESEDRLFSMTAINQNLSDFQGNGTYATDATAQDVYAGELAAAATEQAFHSELFAYDVVAVAGDPLYQFAVRSPTNADDAEIDGFEFAMQHFFGESGFGYQANYTTVDGDIGYDNGGDPSVDQFALEGLSDSANFVAIYEKEGFSARLAYNWRDQFLNQVNRPVGSTRNPEYVDEVEQIDLNVSYTFDSGLSIAFDAINLTSEGQRKFGRTETAVFFVQELDPRYTLSARYSF